MEQMNNNKNANGKRQRISFEIDEPIKCVEYIASKITNVYEDFIVDEIDISDSDPDVPHLPNTNLTSELQNFFCDANRKTKIAISNIIEENEKYKKCILANARNTYTNLLVSFMNQQNDSNIEYISLKIKGCLNMKIKPTINDWLKYNEGRSFAIHCFINDQKSEGCEDIKINKISDFSYDDKYDLWNGGNEIEIKCKNKNYCPNYYSSTSNGDFSNST
jgi:hypothetical protein